MTEALANYQQDRNYHNRAEISRTDLVQFRKSPAHFSHHREAEKETTPAMKFGEAYHLRVLEPEKFKEQVGILNEDIKPEPDKTFASKANKQAKEDFEASYPIILSQDEGQQIENMATRLNDQPAIAEILGNPLNEFEREFYEFVNGVDIRAKIDISGPDFIADLKTTTGLTPDKARKEVFYTHYYQAAFYNLARRSDLPVCFIIQDKNPPFVSCIVWVDHGLIHEGLNEIYRDLNNLADCMYEGKFPGLEYWGDNEDGSFNTFI